MNCPTCDDRIAGMSLTDQAMIRLRHAAHEFSEAWGRHFDLVRSLGWQHPDRPDPRIAELLVLAEAADTRLADAAVEYADAVMASQRAG